MNGALRPLDVLCRWGGEEFVTILPNLDIETLTKIAERIRMLVESTWMDIEGGAPLQITVSVGGALSRPKEDWKSIVTRADRAMYDCKQGGRNRVRILP